MKLFAKISEELTVNGSKNIILCGSCLNASQSLRSRVLSKAHEGQQGLVKIKQLIREKIWFPGINKDVKNMVDNCLPCQTVGNTNKPVPLRMNELPPVPWHTLHRDHCETFPSREYIQVVIDAYIRFPEIPIVKSTQGLPSRVKPDDGTSSNSTELRDYMN